VSAALYNTCVQAGNIIATHIYNDPDKPYYQSVHLLSVMATRLTHNYTQQREQGSRWHIRLEYCPLFPGQALLYSSQQVESRTMERNDQGRKG
jgi:hypothetical protein